MVSLCVFIQRFNMFQTRSLLFLKKKKKEKKRKEQRLLRPEAAHCLTGIMEDQCIRTAGWRRVRVNKVGGGVTSPQAYKENGQDIL